MFFLGGKDFLSTNLIEKKCALKILFLQEKNNGATTCREKTFLLRCEPKKIIFLLRKKPCPPPFKLNGCSLSEPMVIVDVILSRNTNDAVAWFSSINYL